MATVSMSDFGKGTIYSVSKGTGYSIADIIAANPGIDINDIASNATINLPNAVMESVNIDDYGSIYSISQKTGVSVDDIIAANSGIDINSIPSGANINLPSGSIIPIPKSALEVVNIDDYGSIYSISQKTGVPVSDIVAANPNIDVNNISSGTKINVPSKNNSPEKPPAVTKPKTPTPKQEAYEEKVEEKKENDVGNEPKTNCKCKAIVILDPGHGDIFNKYRDPGAVYKVNNKVVDTEKDIALLVSKSLKVELEKFVCIKSVHLTRSGDIGKVVRFKWRIDKAKKTNSDIFISIHLNASTNTSARGSSILKYKQPNIKSSYLASSISTSYTYMNKNRGIKKQDVSVLRRFQKLSKGTAPACLIELGFISNTNDRGTIKTKHKEIAKQIAKGIKAYVKNKHCK